MSSATVWTEDDVRKLPPTIPVHVAAQILGVSRSLAYQLAKSGEFPTNVLRLGNRLMVPTAELRQVLHIEEAS